MNTSPRSLSGQNQKFVQPQGDPAEEELRRRYAAGEISREDFLQRKIDLER